MMFLFSMNNWLLKKKKEDGMKKLVIFALAVLLAMPVLSHAGAVNNRYDMTIGGFILSQFGWSDQSQGYGVRQAFRNSGNLENDTDEFGNLFWGAEGRVTFMVKGPDAWGAKTGAKLEFDFLGAAQNQSFGEAYLRHAYLTFDWAQDQLLIGNTWFGAYDVGMPPPGGTLASLPNVGIPSRTPQIRWTHKFGKNFVGFAGVEFPAATRWLDAGNDYFDNYTRSMYPNVYGAFWYQTDSCGKIGPMMLKVGASGVYGRQKIVRGTTATGFSAKQDDGWMANFFAYVPIVPEKKNNKAGAVAAYAGFITGQGLAYNANLMPAYYLRNAADTDSYVRTKGYGIYTGLYVWLHDKVYLSASYTDQKPNVGSTWRNANLNATIRNTLYNLALVYDPIPAIRLGVEYTRLHTRYGGNGYVGANPYAYKRYGTMNELRFHAGYYF